MKPDIILHIGTEKTGSTSIQKLLRSSEEHLSKSGILFPKSLGNLCHINFTACALGKSPEHPIRMLRGLKDQKLFLDFVKKIKNNLKEEIKRTSPSVVVISDEHINVHLSNTESLLAFKELCEEFGEIKSVIIYLRRQDDFRLSMFSQGVRSGGLSSFLTFGPLPIFKTIPYRLNYLQMLNNLSSIFGDDVLIPKIYDRSTFPNNDIRADFIKVSGINIPFVRGSSGGDNKSIDARIIKHLALISSLLKKINRSWSEKLRRSIIKKCENIFTGTSLVLKQEAHDLFMEQFDSQNEIVKKKYFGHLQGDVDLFPKTLFRNSDVTQVYPDCAISWLSFFVQYLVGLATSDAINNVASKSQADSALKDLQKDMSNDERL